MERMSDIVPLQTACIEIDEAEVREHFTASFGIFSGRPERQAILVFSQESARWVAEERWHINQQARWLANGTYELRLPYTDQRELIMEILRYGPDVRVEAPAELRQAVEDQLERALHQYGRKMQKR
ncbi:MAG: WYL domain-containing protein [Sulfurimonas sp.]